MRYVVGVTIFQQNKLKSSIFSKKKKNIFYFTLIMLKYIILKYIGYFAYIYKL